jgi:hypothetical protein
VTRVTTEDRADFVPVSEHIAVFDNDGTLWFDPATAAYSLPMSAAGWAWAAR